MQHNEQPPPSPEQIAILTAEIRANWTPEEELQRRVVKGGERPVETHVVTLDEHDDIATLVSA